MKKLFIYTTIFFSLVFSLLADDEKLFGNILQENQKIHKSMIETKRVRPDLSKLDNSLSEYIAKGRKNKKEIKKLKILLKKSEVKNFSTFEKNFSIFSTELNQLMKKYRISKQYNRFYCPMLKIYWISKGKKTQNPYAPKMRGCGVIKN